MSEEIAVRLAEALAADRLVAQATVVAGPGSVGAKRLVFPDGETVGSLGGAALDEEATAAAREMLRAARGQMARTIDLDLGAETVRIFIELFPPPPHLVIFGGVHVAIPLVGFARTLGYRVTVADPRTKFANSQRFPHADAIIPAWPDKAVAEIEITPSTYVVVLTHDPKIDEPALKAVVGKGAAYVGAIGSRKTHTERFARMARHGISAEALGEVYAPIGLDLNAETPEEIALAIMAEIVAVRRGGRAGFMRDGAGEG